MPEYLIHDNGGRPFRVCEEKGTCVRVDKVIDIDDNDVVTNYKTLLEWEDVSYIFIGHSPKNRMTEFSGGHGPKFLGNSILLRLGDTYIYIGSQIYQFDTFAPITTFVSPVGNNDVPYPFAFDANDHCYLFLEKVCVAYIPKEHRGDPYEWYYDTCEQMQERYGKLIVGDEEYNYYFSFKKDWSKEYDRLSRLDNEEGEILYLRKGNNTAGSKQVLSLPEFIAQHETFAKDVLQVTGLHNYRLLQKRR